MVIAEALGNWFSIRFLNTFHKQGFRYLVCPQIFGGKSEYFGAVSVSCQERQTITLFMQCSQLNIVGLSADNEELTLKIIDLNGKEIKKDILTL